MSKRKVVLYISMSVDGFIATKDDDLSWLSAVQREGEDYGYNTFCSSVDTYIVGRRTYEKVMELTGGDFPQAKQFRCFVITRKELDDKENITFFNGDIESLITDLKKEKGKNIYCDGGSQIVNLLLEKDLIDEFIISVIPIMLGDGIRLFEGGLNGISLKALPSKYFDTGLVQLHYERIREN